MRIVVERIDVSYPRRRVIHDFSAVMPRGEVGVLVGPSGSGKSTLLAALAGFHPVDSGTVRFVAESGRASPPDPRLVAWVPQNMGALTARSALDNVMIGALSRGVDVRRAVQIGRRCLARVGLGEHSAAPAAQLSGGELQRLSLARALATERPVLFADEPTSNLDLGNTRMVARTLAGLRGGATVVVATHDPAIVAISEHVVALRPESDDA